MITARLFGSVDTEISQCEWQEKMQHEEAEVRTTKQIENGKQVDVEVMDGKHEDVDVSREDVDVSREEAHSGAQSCIEMESDQADQVALQDETTAADASQARSCSHVESDRSLIDLNGNFDPSVLPLHELRQACSELILPTGGQKSDLALQLMTYAESILTPAERASVQASQPITPLGVEDLCRIWGEGKRAPELLRQRALERFLAACTECFRKPDTPRGLDVVFHRTKEENIQGILEVGLRVADGTHLPIAHGAKLGHGVYASRAFDNGKKYGNVAIICLALRGISLPCTYKDWPTELDKYCSKNWMGRICVYRDASQVLPLAVVQDGEVEQTTRAAWRLVFKVMFHMNVQIPSDFARKLSEWIRLESKSQPGKYYFVHVPTGCSQWEPPNKKRRTEDSNHESSSSGGQRVEEGHEMIRLESRTIPGCYYYCNKNTGSVQLLQPPSYSVESRSRGSLAFNESNLGQAVLPEASLRDSEAFHSAVDCETIPAEFAEIQQALIAFIEDFGGTPNFPSGCVTLQGKLRRNELQALSSFEYISLTVEGLGKLQQNVDLIQQLNNKKFFLENPGTQALERLCGFTMHADRPGSEYAVRQGPQILIAAFQGAKETNDMRSFFENAFDRHSDPCLEGRVSMLIDFLQSSLQARESDDGQ